MKNNLVEYDTYSDKKSNLYKVSSVSRYLLMHLSRLTDGLINNHVENKTIKCLERITFLSGGTIFKCVKELEREGIIGAERKAIFSKGKGVKLYSLFERYDFPLEGKQKIIWESVLSKNDLKPLQKFIFIILLSKSNDLGGVAYLTFEELIKEVGITESRLKSNLINMIEKGFIHNFIPGGNLSIFTDKEITRIYINTAKYRFNDIQSFEMTSDIFHYDAYDYFMNNTMLNSKIQSYIETLNSESIISFITTVVAISDDFTGVLLSQLNRDTYDDKSFATHFIKQLEREVFEIKIGRKFGLVNYSKLTELINLKPFYEGILIDIKSHLFVDGEMLDNSLPKDEVLNAILFLVWNNSYIYYMKQSFVSFEYVDFSIVRKYENIKSVYDVGKRKVVLIMKKTPTTKARHY